MISQDQLARLGEHLAQNNMGLLGLRPGVILVHWGFDNSYVCWRWVEDENGFAFSLGKYYKDIDSAFLCFHTR
jgi:hypothetical protein